MIHAIKGKAFTLLGRISIISAALMIMTACLSQPHPVKKHFALSVEPAMVVNQPTIKRRTLLVGAVTAAAGFDNRGLVYRLDGDRFETDFYNELMAPPARILADQTSQYLDQSSPRFRVVKTPGLTLAQYGLETHLIGLYGDYSVKPPQAVVSVRYTLNDLRGSNPKVIWDKTYHQSSAVAGKTPEALTAAMSRALAGILAELDRDISVARQ